LLAFRDESFERLLEIPEARLILKLIGGALDDVERRTGPRFESALCFFASRRLEMLCDWIGLDADPIRARVRQTVAGRFREEEAAD
jgi:hypothetical protein